MSRYLVKCAFWFGSYFISKAIGVDPFIVILSAILSEFELIRSRLDMEAKK